MANNYERNDEPVFSALRNSDLVCVDCVLRAENDFSVFACAAYPNGKPGAVFNGNDCYEHMTIAQAMEKYGKDETVEESAEENRRG